MKNVLVHLSRLLVGAACLVTLILTAQPVPSAPTVDPSYDVDIVFMGLMTFQFGTHSATVMIPNVNPGRQHEGDDGHPIEVHKAYILVGVGSIDPLNASMTGTPSVSHGEKIFRFVQLNGEEIALDDANDVWDPSLNPPLDYKMDEDGNACPTAATQTSMHWLSSIARVTGATQTPDTGHFVRRPNLDTIIGRVVLVYGNLAAHVLKGTHVSDFRVVGAPPPGKAAQAVAQEVHWTFKARGVPFILHLSNFDGVNSRRLAFRPDASNRLLLVVGNTMQDDIGALPTTTPPQAKDNHYAVYHEFIAGDTDGKGPIPFTTTQICDPAYLFDRTLILPPAPPAPAMARATMTKAVPPPPVMYAAPGGLNCGPDNWP